MFRLFCSICSFFAFLEKDRGEEKRRKKIADEGIVKLIDRHTEKTWRAVEENRRKTGICRKTVYGELCIPPIKEK